MNPAALLFQLATSLLLAVQQNGQLPQDVRQHMVLVAEQAIQISTQAQAVINFPVPQNSSIWPNVTELLSAPYIGLDGKYVQQGPTLTVLNGYTSFGDLNGDGVDDAAVIVQRTDANGNVSFALAAMLNQGGILFNIADLPLGNTMPQIFDHSIQNGTIALDMQIGNQPRSITHYVLFGDLLEKTN
jgi:hypothetical protein